MEEIRLQKFLANAGIASRRNCEILIKQGKVKVNGKIITHLGSKIDPTRDIVEFNGEIVYNDKKKYTYILLNKPIGYVTTVSDEFRKANCT